MIKYYQKYFREPVKSEYKGGFKKFIDKINLSLVPTTAELGLLFYILLTILDAVRFNRDQLIGDVHNTLLFFSHSIMALNIVVLIIFQKNKRKIKSGTYRRGRRLVMFILVILGISLLSQAILTLQTRDTIYTTAVYMLIVNLVFHLNHKSRIIINSICLFIVGSVIIIFQWYNTEMLLVNLLEYLGATIPALIFATYQYNLLGREFSYEKDLQEKSDFIKSEFTKRLTRLEMDALQAQMNPHFIFNCLNSIDYYILKNESDQASDYLNRFSKLIRLILKNSRQSEVNLAEEIEALQLYIELEQLRFNDDFNYLFEVKDVRLEDFSIPPMLLQPYIENAIWHGLMHKDGEKWIKLEVFRNGSNLLFHITDNGIGRKRSAELKSKSATQFKSMGMRLTQSRLDILNKIYHGDARIQIIDKQDMFGKPSGTRVEISIPIN